ncbi:MAG: leucine--tRNA ligase [Bacillota bacterium]
MKGFYDFNDSEKKWHDFWEEKGLHEAKGDEREKYYALEMFPYPSGDLHMGHVRVYSIGDVIARYQRMQNKDVLHPMGFDSFGLPAENAAIKHGNIHPKEWTWENIERMRKQLKELGLSYDWDREVVTASKDYYEWNQWLFLKMYEKGLAYKDESAVNWCPSCETVLANEQVVNESCERCGTKVEKKELEQWFFKITEYADRLLDDIEILEDWPERVKLMQKNWIGRSEGTRIKFQVADYDEEMEVFTTRPDTIFGATYMVLAPEHPLVDKFIANSAKNEELENFVEKVKNEEEEERTSSESEKEGMFTGEYAINPMTGKKIPIMIGNYVLMSYGTGAIMAVPAHDQRDFDFAKKYDISITPVIQPEDREDELKEEDLEEAYSEDGYLINSGEYNGLSVDEAFEKIADYFEENDIGHREKNYRLRDWLISRQRYWGTPIPVVYCDNCGVVPIPEDELPVELPHDVEFKPTGESPLKEVDEFVNTTCPKCGGEARRETDTMDTFVDSSWYFLRYADSKNDELPFSKEKADSWMPVDQYIGGIEHAILHLLYARFFTKVLYDMDLVSYKEPFSNLLAQGMVLKDGAKMSKSKGNVVDPKEILEKYGADVTRLFMLFAAPPEKDLEWNEEGVEGAERFINRVWRIASDNYQELTKIDNIEYDVSEFDKMENELYRKLHQTIKDVTEDVGERLSFNTAISRIMELTNTIYQYLNKSEDINYNLLKESLYKILILLAPFAPHMTEELWHEIGYEGSIHECDWPDYKEKALKKEEITVVIQINGKVRDRINVSPDISEEELKEKAKEEKKVQEYIEGKEIIKEIVVPKKLINIVVK